MRTQPLMPRRDFLKTASVATLSALAAGYPRALLAEAEVARVVAVFDWLRANYTLDENPGMGPQGLYYYLHTMTKALTAYGVEELELKDGRKLNWRKEVAMRLIDLQQRDGSWSNDNGRWWEKDPALVTSYAALSLELLWRAF